MTVGQCVSDVCHNSALRSLCVPQQQRTAKVVGSNPNQAWNGWNVLSGGTLESREEPPYRPPPGLLGLIYGLSSGQEIPHFPSLGLFCNGKLHHLPNLWNIFMGKCGQKAVWSAEQSSFFHASSVWFSFIPTKSDLTHRLLCHTKDLILNGQWWYTAAAAGGSMADLYSIGFMFHWFHPLRPPTCSHNACQTKLQHNPCPFRLHISFECKWSSIALTTIPYI